MTRNRLGTAIPHELVERIVETGIWHIPHRDNVGSNRKHENTPPKDLLPRHILT